MTDPGLCFKQGIALRRLCSPWRRKWQSTPVFLPGESQHRSLAGYSPWGRKESDMTEWLSMHTHTHTHMHAHGGASLWLGLNRTCFGSAYCVQLCSLTSSLPRHPFMTSWDILKPFWLSFKFFLSWSIVDLQCYVGYRCTAKWFSDILNLLMYIFHFQNIHLCCLSYHLPKSHFPSL